MAKNKSMIPLCRSRFLEDVTIAFGRRSLKSLRKSNPTLVFEVTEDGADGTAMERLDIEARTILGRITKITLWEDGLSWVYCQDRCSTSSKRQTLDFHARLDAMNIDEIVELLRKTLVDAPAAEAAWKSHIEPGSKGSKAEHGL
jgi:hypothetical protein